MSQLPRIAIGLSEEATDDDLRFAKQLGCEGVVLATPSRLPGEHRWEYEDLVRLRAWVESHGLRIESLQNTPARFIDPIRLGLPNRDEVIEHYQATVRNVGRAGIPILSYNWRPNQLYRTGRAPGRGGVTVTTFDLELAPELPLSHGRVYTADEMWATYEYFLRAVLPVAEEAGVRLALHPDDPIGIAAGGVARIMSSPAAFRRAAELVESPSWGVLFCVGCWAEMGGTAAVLEAIRHFGPRGQIAYLHFRDLIGTAEHFTECFIGEGELDLTAIMRALVEVGYGGPVIDDHAPPMVSDDGWAPRARAYQAGYLQGLLRAITDLA